jgi:hypothetical protein
MHAGVCVQDHTRTTSRRVGPRLHRSAVLARASVARTLGLLASTMFRQQTPLSASGSTASLTLIVCRMSSTAAIASRLLQGSSSGLSVRKWHSVSKFPNLCPEPVLAVLGNRCLSCEAQNSHVLIRRLPRRACADWVATRQL